MSNSGHVSVSSQGIGSRTPTDPVSVVCSGEHRDMGRQQGAQLRSQVRMAREFLAQLEVFRREQPFWLAYPLFRALAEWKARKFLREPMSRVYPEQHERLLGLAEGAGLAASALYLIAALESGLCSLKNHLREPVGFACSAIGIGRQRSGTGDVLLAHNFDYLPLVKPLYVLRESRPAGAFRSLEFTLAPLAGAVDGVNERGLAITYDYAFPRDDPKDRVPISFAIAGALARCETVSEAVQFISHQPRWGGAMLLLADAAGDLGSLELTNTRAQFRRPDPGVGLVHHTNCFQNADTRACEIPSDSVFGTRAPAVLRGTSVLGPHAQRNRRIHDLLEGHARFGLAELTAVMADHGPSGVPGGDTPCVHTNYWETTACLQLMPKQRRLRVSWTRACQTSFQEATL